MSSRQAQSSFAKLLKLYAHRKRLAELRIAEQLAEVQKVQAEVRQREAVVEGLSSQLKQTYDYLEVNGSSMGARMLEHASKHQYWLDYDRQKEAFYLGLAVSELNEKRQELQQRRHDLNKLNARQGAVDALLKKKKRQDERKRDRLLEAEFHDLMRGMEKNEF